MTTGHKLYVGLETFRELANTGDRGEGVRVPFRSRLHTAAWRIKLPRVGDIVEVRSTDRNEACRAVVVSVESDDEVTTTLERQRCALCDALLPIFRSTVAVCTSSSGGVEWCGWDPARPDGFPR